MLLNSILPILNNFVQLKITIKYSPIILTGIHNRMLVKFEFSSHFSGSKKLFNIYCVQGHCCSTRRSDDEYRAVFTQSMKHEFGAICVWYSDVAMWIKQ